MGACYHPRVYYMIVDQEHVKVFVFLLCNTELGKYRIDGSVLVIRGQL